VVNIAAGPTMLIAAGIYLVGAVLSQQLAPKTRGLSLTVAPPALAPFVQNWPFVAATITYNMSEVVVASARRRC
jgi:hypothetical protein